MTDWLLKFGFGGVQEFIGQARKTRDLGAGSVLISELIRAALKQTEHLHSERILPQDPTTACPHQAVLLLSGRTKEEVKECGEGLRECVAAEWRRHADPAKLVAPSKAPVLCGEGNLAEQIESAFETYWVAVPLGNDYRAAFTRLGALFDDRRHTRTFAPLPPLPDKPQWACLQCGVRVAVVDKDKLDGLTRRSKGLFSKRDHLCAVCLAKRLWSAEKFKEGFPSTQALARDRLFREPLAGQLSAALGGTPLKPLEQLELFDRWEEFAEAEEAQKEAERKNTTAPSRPAGRVWDAYQKVRAADGLQKGFAELSPYYALVVFDGDEMGKWFRGERFQPGCDLRAAQAALGQALTAFSSDLAKLPELGAGRLVYAGGDDGLALLPLDYLLPFVQALRDRWREKVREDSTLKAVCADDPPTFSLHASVVHESAPLQQAVSVLHHHLEETKERGGRNAFSLRADVRAGSEAMMVAAWDELDTLGRTLVQLTNWRPEDVIGTGGARPSRAELERRSKDELPTRLPHKLIEAAHGFFDTDGGCIDSTALDLELRRASRAGDSGPTADPLIEWLVQQRVRRAWPRPPEPGKPITSREAMESALKVLSFLARELHWKEAP